MGINLSTLGRAFAATAVIASSVLLGIPSTASAAPGESSVSGTVTDGDGNPVPNVNISIDATDNQSNGWAQTDALGNYTSSPLPPGDYRVRFNPNDSAYAEQYWDGQPSWDTATILTISNDTPVTGVNAQLMASATISGHVQNQDATPLEQICVNAETAGENSRWLGNAQTDTSGDYSITGLPPLNVVVNFHDCNNPQKYLDQWHDGVADRNNAQQVWLTPGTNTIGVDATMQLGAKVSGTVTDGDGNPVPNVNVSIDATDYQSNGWAQTDALGNYTSSPLPPGDYRVRFNPNDSAYAEQYWDGQPSWDTATILTISSDTPVTGVNAQLMASATISGHVQNQDATPLEQICVNAETAGENSRWLGNAQTDTSGDYSITGLPPLNVVVNFHDCNNPQKYLDQWHDGVADRNNAHQLSLLPGTNLNGINATLDMAVTVSGTVTDGDGNPVPNVNVSIDATDYQSNGWAQTDALGNYTSSPLPPGDYRVRFNPNDSAYAEQYWDGQPSWDTATILTISSNTPVTGVNAQLMLNSRISGRVTKPGGSPTPDICVRAAIGTNNDWRDVAGSQTDASGNYEFSHLSAGTYRVHFEDCNHTGSYLDQWYNDGNSFDSATTIDLVAGESRTDVNAELQPAAQIQGTVSNTDGTPLEGICVQASTDDFLGGMDHTDSDGAYSIELARGGRYKVQFVDCGEPEDEPPVPGGTYLAQWWGGGLEPGTAKYIDLAVGSTVDNIDAALPTAGGTGTVSGRVTNVRGEPLNACIALFLPHDHVRFGMTDSNGEYSFTNVPTGTWTLGFLGCGDEDVEPVIPDAGGTGVFFNAMWFDGNPIQLDRESPDPIAQGATLITIGPAEAFEADMCFGCGAVQVNPPVVGEDFILVDFDTTGLSTGDGTRTGAQATLTYNVACDSKTGKSTSASQDNFPVKVSGFTPGAPYVCSAHILSNGMQVADSTTFEVTVGKAVPAEPGGEPSNGPGPTDNPTTPTQPSGNSGEATGPTARPASYDSAGAAPAKLAYTGGNIAAVVALAAFMILMGIGVIATTMRMNSHQDRRRATS